MGTTTLMTFAEFEKLPDGPEQLELLEGELVRMPPPERTHMEVTEQLYKRLDAAVSALRQSRPQAGLGKVHIEMGYLLTQEPRSWLRPDVSITQPGQPGQRYYEGAPLFAFEVVSREDRAIDLNRKVGLYLRHGAAEVWLIYPEERQAWVHRRDARQAYLEDTTLQSPLLPGVEIPLASIFE
jgi:Uma2 family endonuclease